MLIANFVCNSGQMCRDRLHVLQSPYDVCSLPMTYIFINKESWVVQNGLAIWTDDLMLA